MCDILPQLFSLFVLEKKNIQSKLVISKVFCDSKNHWRVLNIAHSGFCNKSVYHLVTQTLESIAPRQQLRLSRQLFSSDQG